MSAVLGTPLALSLLALPGAWLAFGLRLEGTSVRARVALAVVLSPAVLVPQFYLLRALGAPFELTAWLLSLLNLPALWLVVRRLRGVERPDLRGTLLWGGVLLLPAYYLAAMLHDTQRRANGSHAWTHTDIVYLLANGALRPEEPQLAGVRLAYPWLGHVPQALVSYLLDGAPNSTYVVANVVWLLAAVILVAEIVATLGGGRLAQATSAAWLCFAVNAVGTFGRLAAPDALRARFPVWGDVRYTPWLRKFVFFQQTTLGIVIFAALLYALTRPRASEGHASWLALVAILLLSAALLYPVLFPASAALVGARLFVLVVRRLRSPAGAGVPRVPGRDIAALACILAAAAAAAWAFVAYVSADRAGAPTVGLSSGYEMRMKAATAAVVLSPLLAGLLLAARRLWREERDAVAVLALGALGSVALNVVFDVYNWANEYKYMFTAAACLAPFPVLALSHRMRGRAGVAAALALAVALAAASRPSGGERVLIGAPVVDVGRFELRLATREPLAGVTDAIRAGAPPRAVIVSRASPFDLATVTRRAVYVPYDTAILKGIGLTPDFLLERSRGYDAAIVDRRRETVRALYETASAPDRERLVAAIVRDIRRPVVFIVRQREDAGLAAWLASWPAARRILESGGYSAWIVEPDDDAMFAAARVSLGASPPIVARVARGSVE